MLRLRQRHRWHTKTTWLLHQRILILLHTRGPMNVESPKEAVVPETSTGGAASSSMGQFVDTPAGMEISEADLKHSEFEEVPESRKVRRINGLVVCSMDIVGAAQVVRRRKLTKSRMRCILTKANR